MTAQWESCYTSIDGHVALITVDMGAGHDLRRLDVPNLLRVQYVLKQPDEHGFPGERDEQHIDRLRTELGEWIRAAGGRPVGEITAAGQHSWLFYMPCGWREATQLVHRIGLRLGLELGAEMMPDACHRVYFEQLLPSDEEWRMNDNAHLLCALVEAGDDLQQPRTVTHYALFEDRTQALSMARWARHEGYAVRAVHMSLAGRADVTRPAPAEHGAVRNLCDIDGGWLVEFSRHMSPQPKAIDADTGRIMQATARMGGMYCGWQAPAVLEAGDDGGCRLSEIACA